MGLTQPYLKGEAMFRTNIKECLHCGNKHLLTFRRLKRDRRVEVDGKECSAWGICPKERELIFIPITHAELDAILILHKVDKAIAYTWKVSINKDDYKGKWQKVEHD
jgi:hypothetical protein